MYISGEKLKYYCRGGYAARSEAEKFFKVDPPDLPRKMSSKTPLTPSHQG